MMRDRAGRGIASDYTAMERSTSQSGRFEPLREGQLLRSAMNVAIRRNLPVREPEELTLCSLPFAEVERPERGVESGHIAETDA
ncbi:hypothetical protein [Mesorhizobium sp. L48C026A00]|uniref:hypothetical protein n=1 Tax=Mesorhizobium sp. L48C026A00 TaxID=1287182 RepID=UPI0003D040DD|nr:hypothetical protein [Mesorhizobium sp. L48C026A00]ESZ13037.1 hypothetical protein X737_26535 [Mesorhizobium sp. L48C026A00]